MNESLHIELARSINSRLKPCFPREEFEKGASYPNQNIKRKEELLVGLGLDVGKVYLDERKSRRQENHHALDFGIYSWRKKLLQLLQNARKEWKAGEREESGFLFGVFTHLAADYAVPHSLQNAVHFGFPPEVGQPGISTYSQVRNAVEELGRIRREVQERNEVGDQAVEIFRSLVQAAYAVTEDVDPPYFHQQFQIFETDVERKLHEMTVHALSHAGKMIKREKIRIMRDVVTETTSILYSKSTACQEVLERLRGGASSGHLPCVKERMEDFRESIREHKQRPRDKIRDFIARRSGMLQGKKWYRRAADEWFDTAVDEWLTGLEVKKKRALDSCESYFQERRRKDDTELSHFLEDARANCMRKCDHIFAQDWTKTLPYRIVKNGGVYVHYILLWMTPGLTLLTASLLAVLVAHSHIWGALSLSAAATCFVCGFWWKGALKRWQELSAYADEVRRDNRYAQLLDDAGPLPF